MPGESGETTEPQLGERVGVGSVLESETQLEEVRDDAVERDEQSRFPLLVKADTEVVALISWVELSLSMDGKKGHSPVFWSHETFLANDSGTVDASFVREMESSKAAAESYSALDERSDRK